MTRTLQQWARERMPQCPECLTRHNDDPNIQDYYHTPRDCAECKQEHRPVDDCLIEGLLQAELNRKLEVMKRERAEVELAELEKAVINTAQAWVDDREALANFHARVGWRDTDAELKEAVTALRGASPARGRFGE